jgi:hypothetical protein
MQRCFPLQFEKMTILKKALNLCYCFTVLSFFSPLWLGIMYSGYRINLPDYYYTAETRVLLYVYTAVELDQIIF